MNYCLFNGHANKEMCVKKVFVLGFLLSLSLGSLAQAVEVAIKSETFDATTYSIDESRFNNQPRNDLVVTKDDKRGSEI